MPQALESFAIVPDTHRPYHDRTAWRLFLKALRAFRPHHLVCIGDFADFYAVSSHSKDPRRTLRLEEELADVNRGLDELDALGATRKYFCAGNHSDRLTRYLRDRAPELYGLVGVPEVFRLKARGWAYTPYKDHVKIGKVHFTHDVGSSGRTATFKALDTYQHSVVTGHSHRLQFIVEGNALGEQKLSAQFGWLGDAAQVDYLHRARVKKDWALGFGIGHLNPRTGVLYAVPVPIVVVKDVYSCVVQGTLFEERRSRSRSPSRSRRGGSARR